MDGRPSLLLAVEKQSQCQFLRSTYFFPSLPPDFSPRPALRVPSASLDSVIVSKSIFDDWLRRNPASPPINGLATPAIPKSNIYVPTHKPRKLAAGASLHRIVFSPLG